MVKTTRSRIFPGSFTFVPLRMKILAIGDLHGKKVWKTIPIINYDRVIFLGDYVDGRGISDDQMIENLEQIMALKRAEPGRITLLLGNHDIQYLDYPRAVTADINDKLQPELSRLYGDQSALFEIATQVGRHLFTHAGISQGYFEWLKFRLEDTPVWNENLPVSELINNIFHSDHRPLLLVNSTRRGGFYPYGGPVWADNTETMRKFLPGYHHVVGHNRVGDITTYKHQDPSAEGSITYIDVLERQTKFYEIEC